MARTVGLWTVLFIICCQSRLIIASQSYQRDSSVPLCSLLSEHISPLSFKSCPIFYVVCLSCLVFLCILYCTRASAVPACCDSPSLFSAPGSRLRRWILRASLWSSRSPASAICQTLSTVSSTSSTWLLWDTCFFCTRTNSLAFTARLSEGSSCRLRTI